MITKLIVTVSQAKHDAPAFVEIDGVRTPITDANIADDGALVITATSTPEEPETAEDSADPTKPAKKKKGKAKAKDDELD